jgi:hypothetical protein
MFSFHVWAVIYVAGHIAAASGPTNAPGCVALSAVYQSQVEQTFADGQPAARLANGHLVKKSQIAIKCLVARTPPQIGDATIGGK